MLLPITVLVTTGVRANRIQLLGVFVPARLADVALDREVLC
jgi:hypothetical protein